MQHLGALTEKLQGYLAPEQVNAVRRAYYYSEQAHDGQVRRTGQPYVTHPLAVAGILADMRMDHQSLMAALLHDVIEDTGIAKEALASQFGTSVAELVDGVSKLSQFETTSRAEAQAENFQKMAMAMARDIRVILVKLADRLHNMRTLDVLKPEKRQRIAQETLEIYAPIAQRLGMNNMRIEFEDLGFTALHPMRARRIHAAVRKARGNRKELVTQIQRKIETRLREEHIPARVLGREKHLYSIYQKMRAKGRSFSEIMDVFAFRIVVDSVDSCYRVLGAMHSLYKPVPGHFKDYIAIPKANGYQSLHTVLFGMHGVPIEIQIRTADMEEMANNGIAAHWLYKSSGSEKPGSGHSRARQWVQGLLEMQQRAGNSLEFIESMKIDLFPDEVYVFTPRGDIFALPNGATAVDFAYTVHTDIGNSCVACRIDRNLAPLSTRLQSGQTVEIVTAPRANPNPTWLNFVVTAKARTNIRHYLKGQQQSESIELGRRLLDKALVSLQSSMRTIDPRTVEQLLAETRRASFDTILEEIGLGNRVALHRAPSAREGRGHARGERRGGAAAGDPRHRGHGDQLRQVLLPDTRRHDRRSHQRRARRGGAPRQLQQHRRVPRTTPSAVRRCAGRGHARRIQRRAAGGTGEPEGRDRRAGEPHQQPGCEHREDRHGGARRAAQPGAAGHRGRQPREPGAHHPPSARSGPS
jgi:guanosine-3',5'-bis(diphosphate) 3'-pyrophosphohydrolase